jgi:methionyl-tRNA formyltransferase
MQYSKYRANFKCNNIKKVIFIGNRENSLEGLLSFKNELQLIKIFVLKDSLLQNAIEKYNIPYSIFEKTKEAKNLIIEFLKSNCFDLLISNGCPFILPISLLKAFNPDALFINTHPTFLPHLKGKTPLNGVKILNYNFIGATTHYMDDGIDTGNVLYQEKVDISSDIDQGLIYFISFDLEKTVSKKAIELLFSHDFKYIGENQIGKGSYFNREEYNFHVNFEKDDSETICKKINSLGIISLGNELKLIDNSKVLATNCEIINNEYLLTKFNSNSIGSILYTYDDKLLVKTIDGIIKITYKV